jgi:hypothetical protein
MSSVFHRQRSVRRVALTDLGFDGWVQVRQGMTLRDRERINQEIADASDLGSKRVRDEKTGKMREVVTGINASVAQRAKMRVGLMAWGGPAFCTRDHEDGSAHVDPPAPGQTLAVVAAGSGGPPATDCVPMPMDDESFDMLDDAVATRIVEVIDNANPEPKEGTDNPTKGSGPTS